MIKTFISIIALLLLVGCASSVSEPAPANTSAPTNLPTSTPTPTPEPTPTPVPLEGRLFFDMNGSGLKDEASFNYDAERLTDERQPLQADLLAAIEAYVAGHPELIDGDLITLEEPGLSGYTVCAKSNCVTTDAEGKFQLVEPDVDRFLNISIKDPNAGTPALEMRYVNKWKGEVTVPEYTKDVDATTMGQLRAVPGCETDAAAQVCKQDADTLLVREQHLNDTSIFKLGDGATLQPSNPNEIGLMQGFLTLPFVAEQVPKPVIWNYFDIIGERLFNSEVGYFDTQDGIILSYDGKYNIEGNPFRNLQGVSDSHNGLDFVINVGNLIINAGPNSRTELHIEPDGQLLLFLFFNDSSSKFVNEYGHLNTFLVNENQKVYRGQIIALSGNTGTRNTFNDGGVIKRTPQLHFDFEKVLEKGWHFLDPYRCIINFESTPKNFWGSEFSYWIVDNSPPFSH